MDTQRFAPRTWSVALMTAILTVAIPLVFAILTPEWHLARLWFNPFAIISCTAALADIVLLVVILRKPARTEERVWLVLYVGLATWFALGECMQRLSATPSGALFWETIISPTAFIAPAALLFTLAYTNPSERKQPGLIAMLLFAGAIYIFFADFTNIIFINSTKVAVLRAWGWDYNGALGPASFVAVLWYLPLFAAAIARIVSFRRHTTNPILRQQSLLFIAAMAVPPSTTVVFNLVFPIIGLDNILPVGVPIGCFALLLLVYGVTRYQLLTISPTLFSNAMLGIMHEAVVATDDQFKIIYSNPVAESLLEIKDTQQRVSLLKAFDPEAVPTFKRAFVAADKDVVHIDQLDIRQAHHSVTIPVRLTASRLYLGKSVAWIMLLADITRELQVRSVIEHEVAVRTRELHEARAYLVSSINSLEQGFVLVNSQGELELLNDQASKLFGLHGKDVSHTPAADSLKPAGWTVDISTVISRALTSRRAKQLAVAAADGSFYELYLTPVLAGDQLLGATIIIQDVTEQKILDRSKDEFFSIASHELRTPLTAIRGNMSMFQDYYPAALKDETAKQLVSDTHDASVRLIEIVNDFLDSSSLEQGKMVFNLAPTAVAPLVTAVASDLKLVTDQQHNRLVIDPSLAKLPPALADAGRLRQILYNLLSNANKYSEHATITVSGSVQGDRLTIRVADTGKGISPENQKLLFHKFQQAGDSILTRDNTKGTGLGLYISKLLATNMQGDVVLEESAVGRGSVFAIEIGAGKDKKGATTASSKDPAARAA